jgi:hypothetical protein
MGGATDAIQAQYKRRPLQKQKQGRALRILTAASNVSVVSPCHGRAYRARDTERFGVPI